MLERNQTWLKLVKKRNKEKLCYATLKNPHDVGKMSAWGENLKQIEKKTRARKCRKSRYPSLWLRKESQV